MFLNLLKPEEKTAFLTLAKKVISADSFISLKETTLLESMKKELEIDEEIFHELTDSIEDVCKSFGSSKSKVSALMELIGIGFVDGEFAHEEQDLIFEIAQFMDISKEETAMYIDWAKRVYAN